MGNIQGNILFRKWRSGGVVVAMAVVVVGLFAWAAYVAWDVVDAAGSGLDIRTALQSRSDSILFLAAADLALTIALLAFLFLYYRTGLKLESLYRTVEEDYEVRQVDQEKLRKDNDRSHNELEAQVQSRTEDVMRMNRLMVEEIDIRTRAEKDLKKFKQAIELSSDWMVLTDPSGVITYTNPAARQLAGRTLTELYDGGPWRAAAASLKPSGPEVSPDANSFRSVLKIPRPTGEVTLLDMTVKPLFGEDGAISHFIGTGKDVSREHAARERLEYIAYHDLVTGLPNRPLFLERLQRAGTQRAQARRLMAVIIADVDRFRLVNDSHGYGTGDEVLKEVGRRLSSAVGSGDTVARIGGDEFGILLTDVASEKDVAQVADKLLQSVFQPVRIGAQELVLSLSTGIAHGTPEQAASNVLLENAFTALVRAKKFGGNSTETFSPDMAVRAEEQVAMERKLVQAIKDKSFHLDYQPYYRTTDGAMGGMEALMRWRSPDGPVSPSRFIPLLEQTGLIVEVGAWALDEACAQIARWQKAKVPFAPVAVNVSAIQFRRGDFVKMVADTLRRHHVESTNVVLEITESTFMEDAESARSILMRLREYGFRISIDDFGTGFSSLSYLKRFPVDNLKVDQSFIRDLEKNKDSASIVLATIQMARSLGLKTIAEGVETAGQFQMVRDMGADIVQGYFLCKPVPPAEVQWTVQFPLPPRETRRP